MINIFCLKIWCKINSEIFQPWPPDDGASPGVSPSNPRLHLAGKTPGMGITPIQNCTSVCRVPILLPPPAPQSCIQPYLQTTRVPFVPSHSQPICHKTGHKILLISKSFRTRAITLAAFLSQEPRRVKTPSLFTSSQVIFCLCWLVLHSSCSVLTSFWCWL